MGVRVDKAAEWSERAAEIKHRFPFEGDRLIVALHGEIDSARAAAGIYYQGAVSLRAAVDEVLSADKRTLALRDRIHNRFVELMEFRERQMYGGDKTALARDAMRLVTDAANATARARKGK